MRASRQQLRRTHRELEGATTYSQWLAAAHEADRLLGLDEWRAADDSRWYDADLLREQRDSMVRLREQGRPVELAELLTQSLYRNMADIQAPALYDQALSGTKRLVVAYLDEAERCLLWLAASPAQPAKARLARFEQASRVFGRSALMLSGGATLGFYHLGVIKALLDEDLLPEVLSGASTGAMIAAGICSRNNEELAELYADRDQMRRDGLRWVGLGKWLRTGAALAPEHLFEVLRHNVGDLTFAEAYARSGRVLNISVSPTRVRQKPRLLTHITSPDVLVASAALASSALPGLFPPVVLNKRGRDGEVAPYVPTERWIDGSVHGDLPKLRLSRLHNVNHFIVSQTNPHILPFARILARRGAVSVVADLAGATARRQVAYAADLVRRLSSHGPVRMLSDQAYAVMSQEYRGDIDIHPHFHARAYRKVVSNPTRDDLDFFILEGERAAWPRIAMIRDHTRISRAFATCIVRLRAEVLAEKS